MKDLTIVAVSALALNGTIALAEQNPIEGVATEVDGNTPEVENAGARMRLYEIEAPELVGGGSTEPFGTRINCSVL